MRKVPTFEEFVNESRINENYKFVKFSIDDEKLDQLLHSQFGKSVDYFQEGGDEYYTLPLRVFDRFIDAADSRGFDVDYENSEDSVLYVHENYLFANESRRQVHPVVMQQMTKHAKKDIKLEVTVDKSNRYFSDGMVELSSWYAREFSEHLFGSKHNLKPVDFIGDDTFILAFTGSGLKDLKNKINNYVDSLNKSWNSDGLTIKIS